MWWRCEASCPLDLSIFSILLYKQTQRPFVSHFQDADTLCQIEIPGILCSLAHQLRTNVKGVRDRYVAVTTTLQNASVQFQSHKSRKLTDVNLARFPACFPLGQSLTYFDCRLEEVELQGCEQVSCVLLLQSSWEQHPWRPIMSSRWLTTPPVPRPNNSWHLGHHLVCYQKTKDNIDVVYIEET